MAEFAAIPLWTDALLADTGHLSDEEFGRYVRLMICMWRSPGCKVPNDRAWVSKRLKVTPLEYDRFIAPLVDEFCITDGNYLSQKRLMKEYLFVRKMSKAQSERALSRWRKVKGEEKESVSDKALITLDLDPCPSDAPTPTPTPTPQKDVGDDTRARARTEIEKVTGWGNDPNWMGNFSMLYGWLENGADLDLDILPTIKRLMKAKTGEPPRSLKYFERAVAEAVSARLKPLPQGQARLNSPAQDKPRKAGDWTHTLEAGKKAHERRMKADDNDEY